MQKYVCEKTLIRNHGNLFSSSFGIGYTEHAMQNLLINFTNWDS